MSSSCNNKVLGYITMHCRFECASAEPKGRQPELDGPCLLSTSRSLCLPQSLYSAELQVAAKAQWPVFTMLRAALKATDTHTLTT